MDLVIGVAGGKPADSETSCERVIAGLTLHLGE
jgi:hypothetical protein